MLHFSATLQPTLVGPQWAFIGCCSPTETSQKRFLIFPGLSYYAADESDAASTLGDRRFISARPEQSIEEGMVIMTKERVHHLRLMSGEKSIAIVPIGIS
jgi:hypothetical protein